MIENGGGSHAPCDKPEALGRGVLLDARKGGRRSRSQQRGPGLRDMVRDAELFSDGREAQV
jgi:hypothetical protein